MLKISHKFTTKDLFNSLCVCLSMLLISYGFGRVFFSLKGFGVERVWRYVLFEFWERKREEKESATFFLFLFSFFLRKRKCHVGSMKMSGRCDIFILCFINLLFHYHKFHSLILYFITLLKSIIIRWIH